MSVNLQFYDSSSNLIDFSQGLDLGKVRRGYENISKIFIKNEGDSRADNVSIVSGQIDSLDEDQKLASTWQTFSLDNKNFSSSLDLGNIQAGNYVEGVSEISDNFESQNESIIKFILGSANIDYTSPILTFSQDDATSQAYGRSQIALENAKNLDINFKIGYSGNKEIFSSLPAGQQNVSMAIFAARINASGAQRDNDNTGYLIEFFMSPKYENKCQIKITVGGKGIVGSTDRSYGNIIGDTGEIWIDYYPAITNFRIKLYNDDTEVPCFEIYKDNEQLDIYKYKWNSNKTSTSRTDEKTKVLKDEDQFYITGGKTFFDVNLQKGSNSFNLSDFKIQYNNIKAPIYIKTKIDDQGVNGKKYTSAAVLVYQD